MVRLTQKTKFKCHQKQFFAKTLFAYTYSCIKLLVMGIESMGHMTQRILTELFANMSLVIFAHLNK